MTSQFGQMATEPEATMSLAEALPSAAMLLGGVPLLTVLVMTAARYIASGSF